MLFARKQESFLHNVDVLVIIFVSFPLSLSLATQNTRADCIQSVYRRIDIEWRLKTSKTPLPEIKKKNVHI